MSDDEIIEAKTVEQKDYHNVWDHVDSFIKVYNLMKKDKWSWLWNSKCKYIELRIDMRDGSCII